MTLQEKKIAELYRMILHLEVEIVDTKPTFYNGNRWSNSVAEIFYQCERGSKTADHMEKIIDMADAYDCYVNDTDENEANYKKFWDLYHEIWEIENSEEIIEEESLEEDCNDEEESSEDVALDYLGFVLSNSKEEEKKEVVTIPCKRCCGAGGFPHFAHIKGGVCFRCDGLGVEIAK